ncbi:peptidase inhibitor family I36 protein [Nonomuraea salmonea]|uniref:Peptidase inhibitor family I36 protein n=1 Tax=Nonomuraea salmonea TaxID=46181 RepID=A0ABV5P4L0_9ACTN
MQNVKTGGSASGRIGKVVFYFALSVAMSLLGVSSGYADTAARTAGQDNLEQEIAQILRDNPKAHRIDTYNIQLDEGAMLTFPAPSAGGTGEASTQAMSCDWQRLCLYDGTGGSGTRLSLYSCQRWYYLEDFSFRDKASSIYNAQSGGSRAIGKFVDTRGDGTWLQLGTLATGGQLANLALDRAPDGGTWNNRIDKVWACDA